MCLDRVTRIVKTPLPTVQTVYKVFDYYDGDVRFFHFLSLKLELDKWMDSDTISPTNPDNPTPEIQADKYPSLWNALFHNAQLSYPAGFHCFKSKANAKDFYSYRYSNLIVECQASYVLAEGHQEGVPIIIAKRLYVSKTALDNAIAEYKNGGQ